MATITLEYDGRNTVFNQLIQLFISLGGKVKTIGKDKIPKEAQEIAKSYSDVKEGKIKTHPISNLFEEL